MATKKTYICNKINYNLRIDGDLTKPEWALASKDSLVDTITAKSPRQSTEIKLLWNDEFLYAAFDCEDTYIFATMSEFNDSLWMEEVVEIFIDPAGTQTKYLEFNINPLNTHLHYQLTVKQNGIRQDGTDNELIFARTEDVLKSAIRINKTTNRWQAEIAIPLIELSDMPHYPPQPGDKININLYRIDRAKSPDIHASPLHECKSADVIQEDEYTAWSPTYALQYHCLDKFGTLIFHDKIRKEFT